MKTADVVIVGGGVMGCSIAYHLTKKGISQVTLLEKEPFLGACATGKCAGGVRHQFSTEVNIRLSIDSIRALEKFSEEMDCPIDFHQDGYLFLLSNEAELEIFRRSLALQRRLGVPVEWLSPEEVGRLVPNLSLEGILGATYCAKDGIAEPNGVTQGYATQARRRGAEIRTGVEVTDIDIEHGTVKGVRTSEGSIATSTVINAAGPYAARIGRMAGIEMPVVPYRRHVFTTHPFAEAPKNWLMIIDFATTFYFHRESGGVLMGMSDKDEPSGFDQSVNWRFLDRVLEVALQRYPPLADAAMAHAWAGLYEVTPDANPILGAVPEIHGLVLANGFSGHGFMHAPAVGRLIAELIVDGRTSIDIAPLSLQRFSRQDYVPEVNVI